MFARGKLASPKAKKRKTPTSHVRQKTIEKAKARKKARDQHKDGCTGKKRHTKQSAIDAGTRMLENREDLQRVAVYWCPLCGEHHLTTQVRSQSWRHSTEVALLEKVAVAPG